MAEKLEEDTCYEDLTCSICLDLFEDATLLVCGHTFCRKCLNKYHKTRRAYNDIECPICKQLTQLGKERIQGLAPNVSIKGLVEKVQHDQRQALLIKQSTTLCITHNNENEIFYCKQCNITMCPFCIPEHHDHDIGKKEDIVNDLRQRVKNLGERCEDMKEMIAEEMELCEEHRRELCRSAELVEKEICDAHERKATVPLEKKTKLVKRVQSLQKIQSKKLDSDVANHRQVIADIDELLSQLESSSKVLKDGSAITTCNILADDLDEVLTKETTFQDTTRAFKETVKLLRFISASEGVPELGIVRLQQEERTYSGKNMILPESSGATGISSFVGRIKKTLTVMRVISLPAHVQGMTAMSEDTVHVGYGSSKSGSECIWLFGKSEEYLPSAVGEVCDITKLSDNRVAVSQGSQTLRIFHSNGSSSGVQYRCKNGNYFLRICSDSDDNIYAVNGNPEIYIFRGENSNPEEVVLTGDMKPERICVMKSGPMVVITRGSKPGAVTFIDREGHVITSITASHNHEHLYAAVDSLDRVFVASIRLRSDCLRLSLYSLQGRMLHELMDPTEVPLSNIVQNMASCSLVCLTTNVLAFARQNKLYFIELTL